MNINNKKVIDEMIDFMLCTMELPEINRYYKEFRFEIDYNIYKYGNLDIAYWELEDRLRSFGVTKKFKNNIDIEHSYMHLVRLATDKIINILTNKLKIAEVSL